MERSYSFDIFGIIAILLLSGILPVSAELNDGDWPMLYHDVSHTGRSEGISDIVYSELVLRHVYKASGSVSSPAVADIDGCGKAETVFATRDKLVVLDPGFNELWSIETGCEPLAPTIQAVRGGGSLEVLYACGSEVFLADAKGNILWKYDAGSGITAPPVAANMDYPAPMESIVLSKDSKAHIIDAGGREIKSFNLPHDGSTVPSIGDINADEKLEIYIGTDNNQLNILSYNNPTKWFYDTRGSICSPTVVLEDGETTILLGGDRLYKLVYEEYSQGSVRKCSSNGTCTNEALEYSRINTTWVLETGKDIASPPAIADLDLDDSYEVVTGSLDKTLYILNGSSGEIIHRYSVNANILTSPVIADLNWDDEPEIIFASSDGMVYILNSTAGLVWKYDTGEYIDSSPAVADIDRDYSLEILVPAGSSLYVFGQVPVKREPSTTSTTASSTTAPSTSTTLEVEISLATIPPTSTSTSTTPSTTIPEEDDDDDEESEYVDVSQASLMGFVSLFSVISVVLTGIVLGAQKMILGPRRESERFKRDLQELEKRTFRKSPGTPYEGGFTENSRMRTSDQRPFGRTIHHP